MTSFKQTSSIIRRIRNITVALAFLLLLEFSGTFFSSRTFLEGLTELNKINALTEHSSRALDNIIFARESMEKVDANSGAASFRQRELFRMSYRQAEESIARATELATKYPEATELLAGAKSSLVELNKAANRIFSRVPIINPNDALSLKADILLVKQFEQDSVEDLRKAQILLKVSGDRTFAEVYRSRFNALVVSLLLAAVFFLFTLFSGLSTTRRLRLSLESLLNATDKVAKGDLSVRPAVLYHDEIGQLTAAFGEMVANLERSILQAKESANRTARLQAITAEFSRALEPKEVGDAVLKHGMEVLGANKGAVLSLSSSEHTLEFLSSVGISEEEQKQWRETPPSTELPSSKVMKEKEPLFFESRVEVEGLFKGAKGALAYLSDATAVVPLLKNGEAIGVLSFLFNRPRKFIPEERQFILTLAALTAQALQRATLYEDSQRAIHVRDEFLSIASHELKTPITSMKMQLQMAQRQVDPEKNLSPTPQKIARVLAISNVQLDRLTLLVDDLLDVTRIEAGKLSYEFTEVDLRLLTVSVLERFADSLKYAECPVEMIAPEPVPIRCDRFRMEQVVINLLSNAMKYGPGKPIIITVLKSESTATLSVKDFGIGIAAENLTLIFDRFERAVSSRNVSGLGLGLFIARQIVHAHLGKISVESVPGKGSEFTVELPLFARKEALRDAVR